MKEEHEMVVASEDITNKVKKGTEGTVVHVYPSEDVYEVEFFDKHSRTIEVATCHESQLV